jgi:hypothetical protein
MYKGKHMLGGFFFPYSDNLIGCNLELDNSRPHYIKSTKSLNTSTNMTSPTTPVWFITAASSGFGKYMAFEALNRGHKVIASARSTSRITDLKEAGADVVALDVTSPLPEIEKVAKEANAKYGYITHLVNAAGYILEGAVEETS